MPYKIIGDAYTDMQTDGMIVLTDFFLLYIIW
jgi:hypothetical protein